jgi:NAD(P)-dependent dehydrogenase (short-subunit alcohol dehydrogenase family)
MTGLCEGRVVVVTGAGGGIGRAHALAFAAEGAKVVVNDLGGSRDGQGNSAGPAQTVVDEIVAAGGQAVANTDDVSSWDGAERLVAQAVDVFGGLDVLVNNAGILRDKMLVNMSDAEWDAVIKVHLKGTFAPTRHAAAYWREQSKAGRPVDARIINTTSPSGLFGNLGQANYGSAKAGIATFTIIAAGELARYGITVNAIAPTALTRMTEDLPVMSELAKQDEGGFNTLAPENIAPLAVWLGSPESREVTGRVFSVWGGRITVNEGWVGGPHADHDRAWTPAELGAVIPGLVSKAAPNADMSGERPAT